MSLLSALLPLVGCAPSPLEPVAVDPDHDWDGDGFSEAEGDCDDGVDGIHPAAGEVCDNGVDDDCDGIEVSCDDDGDGVTTAEGDCDDTDDRVFPGAVDLCSNGLDEDCSGRDSTCAWTGDLALPPAAFAPGGFVFSVGDLDGQPGPEVLRSGSLLDVLTVEAVGPQVTLRPWGTVINDIAPSLDTESLEAADLLPDDVEPRLVLGLPDLDGSLDRGALLLNASALEVGTTDVSMLLDTGAVVRGEDGQRVGRAAAVVDGSLGPVVALGGYGGSPLWLVPTDLDPGEHLVTDVALVTFSIALLTPNVGAYLHAVDIDGDGDEEIAASSEPFSGLLSTAAKVYVLEAQGPDRTLDIETEALEGSGPALWSSLHTDSADLDADGYDDLVVGFYADEPGGSPSLDSPGAVHVHRGAAATDAEAWTAGRALGAGALTVAGAAPGGWFGATVTPAGDVDGDGAAELWVGAPLEGDDNRGAAYLISSSASGVVDLALDPDAVIARVEGRAGETLGSGLVVDDFDGDDADDLLIASLQALYVLPGGVIP